MTADTPFRRARVRPRLARNPRRSSEPSVRWTLVASGSLTESFDARARRKTAPSTGPDRRNSDRDDRRGAPLAGARASVARVKAAPHVGTLRRSDVRGDETSRGPVGGQTAENSGAEPRPGPPRHRTRRPENRYCASSDERQ